MKANSERVPGKNFREFCGKPLFHWILDTLLEVDRIDEIVINTDARSILFDNGLVESEKVIIRDRKPELRGDHVSMNLILEDDVDNVEADVYVMTHVTNPLLSAETVRKGLDRFFEEKKLGRADSVFTVNRVQTRFYREDGSAVNHDPNNLLPTQELEPWFEENSNLYVFSRESFEKTRARIGAKPAMLEMDPLESIDIDTPEDWEMALAAAQIVGGVR